MTPEQRVAEAMILSLRSHAAGLTVDDAIECDPCGEQFTHYAKWLARREAAHATAALDAVRDALTSDDPDVVRAMAVRIGLNVSTRTVYELDPDAWRVLSDYVGRALEAETGMQPIDFQVQQRTAANAEHKGVRSALGVLTRIRRDERASRAEVPDAEA